MTTLPVRRPARAGQFYEHSPEAVLHDVKEFTAGFRPPTGMGKLLGGIVPHAGWVYSGATAAKVFSTLSGAEPATFVLLGAVHFWAGPKAALYPAGAWATPLGEIAVDEALAEAIASEAKGLLAASTAAHDQEHSIEVQVPFIQAISPGSRIVPIAVPPVGAACDLGAAIAEALKKWGKPALVVASTDLTHYGMGYGTPDHGPWRAARKWMRENDHRVIRLVEELRAEQIVPESEQNQNACGAGAMAAATAACRGLGATSARVIEYTTSADVANEPDTDRAVGYVGMVFEKAVIG